MSQTLWYAWCAERWDRGNKIEDVLDDLAESSDQTVKWIYPDRPICAAIAIVPSQGLNIQKQAHANQNNDYTQVT